MIWHGYLGRVHPFPPLFLGPTSMTKVAVLQQGLATSLTLGPVRVKIHQMFQVSEDLESSSDVTYVFPQCLGYPLEN